MAGYNAKVWVTPSKIRRSTYMAVQKAISKEEKKLRVRLTVDGWLRLTLGLPPAERVQSKRAS